MTTGETFAGLDTLPPPNTQEQVDFRQQVALAVLSWPRGELRAHAFARAIDGYTAANRLAFPDMRDELQQWSVANFRRALFEEIVRLEPGLADDGSMARA